MDEQQETFAGIGSKVYWFCKGDLQEGVPFEQQADKAFVIDLSCKESKVSRQGFTQDEYNTTFIRQQEDKSGNPIEVIIPNGDKEPKYKSRVCITDNPNPKSENWCQSFSCSGEVELPCDMLTPLCHPFRWGDKHFNRRIAHYQWMKHNNYL